MSTRTGNAVQQYLNHLASLRADASSPATTLRLDDYLDKFPTIEEHAVSRHPSQRQDSPVLGYRPSLDNTTSPTSTTTITSDTQNHFQSTGLIAGELLFSFPPCSIACFSPEKQSCKPVHHRQTLLWTSESYHRSTFAVVLCCLPGKLGDLLTC